MKPCNFCFLDELRQYAAKHQARVELRQVTNETIGGAYPDAVDAFMIDPHGKEAWTAWFASTPTACVCGGLRVVHILVASHALCGQPGLPAEWPIGHAWVTEKEAALANCLPCQIVLETRAAGARFQCPDCGGQDFREGPHGGLSINFVCFGCGARFNDMLGWIARIPADGDERLSWVSPYIPRSANFFEN